MHVMHVLILLGEPHFRHFEVVNNEYLVWYSQNKSLSKTIIRLTDIKNVLKGQNTQGFKRYQQPKLESCSFSIMYNNDGILDLIARNKYEYSLWVKGLEFIIEYFNDNDDTTFIELPAYNIDVTKRDAKAIYKALLKRPKANEKAVAKELQKAHDRYLKISKLINEMEQSKLDSSVRLKFIQIEQEMERLRDIHETESANLTSHEVYNIYVHPCF